MRRGRRAGRAGLIPQPLVLRSAGGDRAEELDQGKAGMPDHTCRQGEGVPATPSKPATRCAERDRPSRWCPRQTGSLVPATAEAGGRLGAAHQYVGPRASRRQVRTQVGDPLAERDVNGEQHDRGVGNHGAHRGPPVLDETEAGTSSLGRHQREYTFKRDGDDDARHRRSGGRRGPATRSVSVAVGHRYQRCQRSRRYPSADNVVRAVAVGA